MMCFLLLLPSTAFAQPAISFGALSYDFGTVNRDNAVKHVFEFTNTGDRELIVKNVTSS